MSLIFSTLYLATKNRITMRMTSSLRINLMGSLSKLCIKTPPITGGVHRRNNVIFYTDICRYIGCNNFQQL